MVWTFGYRAHGDGDHRCGRRTSAGFTGGGAAVIRPTRWMLSRPGWRRYPAGPEAGHADSDERHSVFAADRLPLALICRATAFRSARPSTISFASSSAILWEAIWAELHMALRERMGREASPSA